MSYEDDLFEEMPKKEVFEKDLFEIKNSIIHDKGVFALKDIKSNCNFYLIPMDNVSKTSAPSFARICTNTFVNDPVVLNYVNHSCNPNSEIVLEQSRVVLHSKRKILKGEEITVDYCVTEEKNTLKECKCNSSNCRRFFYITEEQL